MIGYLLVFVSVATLAVATVLGGWALLLPTLILFVAVPSLDALLPQNRENRSLPRWYGALPYLYVPVHFVVLGWALAVVVRGDGSPGERALLTLSIGLASAMAINVAHELMHRPGRVPQVLATLVMTSTSYPHFVTEHVQGHHKHVGTARDPATSRLGEALYAYLPRTLIGGLASAVRIERARAGWGPRNRMWTYAIGWLAMVGLVAGTLGGAGVVAFLVQSAVAVLMLETINYIEHYGLSRAEIAPGRPERVKPRHSWNSSHRVSNWMLLNLARHSDHHAFAARPYTELRHHDDAPQLPGSYSAMILLAAVPPLWFRVMDPRAKAAQLGAPVDDGVYQLRPAPPPPERPPPKPPPPPLPLDRPPEEWKPPDVLDR